jgi:uncharacterized protein YjiS (DUF1127 family)
MPVLTQADLALLRGLDTGATVPPLSKLALRVARLVILWDMRSRSRSALDGMSDHILRDIGLSRQEAENERHKRFWQA